MRCQLLLNVQTAYHRLIQTHPPRRGLSHSAIAILEQAYQTAIPPQDRYCLNKLQQEWVQTQPLKNKKVLLNIHLTRASLPLVTTLLASEVILNVICAKELNRHTQTLHALAAAGISVLDHIPENKQKNYYDIVYDCGGYMKYLSSRHGMVELTHTAHQLYEALPFPVITVYQSLTKVLETGIGTGKSLVRLIKILIRQTLKETHHLNLPTVLPHLIHPQSFFARQNWVMFGYGKVGQGITCALENAGVPKKNMLIVEIALEPCVQAMKSGYRTILLRSPTDHEAIQAIRENFTRCFAVITATGVEGVMSQYFTEQDFTAQSLLINMGTPDEFGKNFSHQRIINHKKPANFMLKYPTQMIYLDPIFSLFLQAGLELLTPSSLKKGLTKVSCELDQRVLSDWLKQQEQNLHGLPKQSQWGYRLFNYKKLNRDDYHTNTSIVLKR